MWNFWRKRLYEFGSMSVTKGEKRPHGYKKSHRATYRATQDHTMPRNNTSKPSYLSGFKHQHFFGQFGIIFVCEHFLFHLEHFLFDIEKYFTPRLITRTRTKLLSWPLSSQRKSVRKQNIFEVTTHKILSKIATEALILIDNKLQNKKYEKHYEKGKN